MSVEQKATLFVKGASLSKDSEAYVEAYSGKEHRMSAILVLRLVKIENRVRALGQRSHCLQCLCMD